MGVSRRGFLRGAAAGAVPLALPTVAAAKTARRTAPARLRPERVLGLFDGLPGMTSVKILAPATDDGRPRLLIERAPARRMFVGSAIKTFALCAALRDVDSPTVVNRVASRQLALDESVWSVDSATFNPPHLSGTVSQRTAMEAMICHSDNTATDMIFKLVGPDRIRRFIDHAGLTQTQIPESTRVFFGYILGAEDYRHFTWKQLQESNGKFTRRPLNSVQTLASSANDLVSYYRRALQGGFFRHPETLTQFHAIQSMGSAIWTLPMPLGVTSFVKGGSIDTPGFHALCVPGGMFFEDRWVFFSITINWFSPRLVDPRTVEAFASRASRAMNLVYQALRA